MLTRFICLALTGLLAAAGLAQDTPMVGRINDVPFEGEVTAGHLNVRVMPKVAPESTIVAVLNRGTKVQVMEVRDGWYGIRPPSNAWVWVWARHIAVGKDGARVVQPATMRTDSRSNAPAVGKLEPGTTVKILKEHLGWFKIVAPESVRLWVSARYVRRQRALQPETPGKAGAPEADAGKGKSDPGEAEAKARIDEARRRIDRMKSLLESGEIEKVDYRGIVRLFEEAGRLAVTEGTRRYAGAMAETYRRMQDHLSAVEAPVKVLKERLRELRETVRKLEPPPKKEFAFTGRVDLTGALLRNRPGTHKLVDEKGNVVCFLKVKDGDDQMRYALNGFYEQRVGVNGTVIHDPEGWVGYSVVIVDEVVPLPQEEEAAPEPEAIPNADY